MYCSFESDCVVNVYSLMCMCDVFVCTFVYVRTGECEYIVCKSDTAFVSTDLVYLRFKTLMNVKKRLYL